MQAYQYQGVTMSFAKYNDGSRVLVEFWVPQGGMAAGFGLFNGRMLRLDVLSGFVEYEVA